MISRIAFKLREKIEFALLRPRQATSPKLREIFRERHRVDVGLYSYGCFDQWRMPGPIRIGRWCSIASTVRSAPINHPLDGMTTHPALYESQFGVVDENIHYDEPLVIEDDVWIGHNAILLPGCKFVGRGAVIGAGAIVTRNVPAYAIVAGNPAKLIRHRFEPETIAALEESRWWEMDAVQLRETLASHSDIVKAPTAASLRAWTESRK
jgi:acetyltransferase-like isoleucine patch superfamily enzyme